MSFPTYPAYKDSGVEWLGEVPEHWLVAPVGMYYEIRNGFPFAAENFSPEGAPEHRLIRIRDILGNDSPLYTDEPCPAQCIVENGDILIGMDGDFNIASWAEGKAKLNQRVCAIRGANFSWDRFFFYGISAPLKIINDLTFATTVKHLASSQILKTRFPIPPETELENIARFLDHETARIDALIEEQQRLIELLKEKRRGIVLSALSDTSLPLVRIGHAVDVISRPVKQKEDESYTPIGLFNRDRGLFHKEPREMQDMGDSDFFWIKNGDLIISGQFAWEGAVAIAGESEEGLVVSHRYPVLLGKHGVANTEYLYAILTTKHGDFLLNESSRGAAGRNRPLNLAALLKEKIRIPSKEIQEQVRNLVQNEAKVLTECRQQISLLQERRSALISAAVTGKIDVRNWQPPASTPAPEPEQEAV